MLMLRSMILVAGMLVMATATTAIAGSEAHWSYKGRTGCANWHALAREWATCAGQYQSPIDLRGAIPTKLGKIKAKIKATPLEFGLDGPTFAVMYRPGSWITVNGTQYELQAFHFHHKSEHTVNGRHFPLEAHIVLRSKGGDHNDAVMGVLIKIGKKNRMLDQFWNQLPRSQNKDPKPVMVNVGNLLPRNTEHFMYEGSMTTPGCAQGVRWFVFAHPVEASRAQVNRFIDDLVQGRTNNRPVQATNGRWILKGN